MSSTVLDSTSTAAPPAPTARQMTPLMAANFAALSSNYAFVALVGALAAVLQLAAWQIGVVITTVGVLWIVCSGPWARTAQRIGHAAALRRALFGLMLSFMALAAYVHWALAQDAAPPVALSFALLLLTRVAAGAFTAGVPVVSIGWIAGHTVPSSRAAVMARYGSAGAVGMVLAPPVAGWLSSIGLPATLWLAALLPLVPLLLLDRLRDASTAAPPAMSPRAALSLRDARIRRPWLSALALYSVVIIANVCIGFYLIERLGATPAGAAAAAGTALGAAGVALTLSQTVMSRLPKIAPIAWLRIGALLAGLGFGSVLLATQPWMVAISFFIAGCGMGLNFPSIAALAANSVEGPEQGACAAAMAKAQGASMVVAPVIGAGIYQFVPEAPFVLMVALLVAVLVSASWHRGSRADA